jgi:hypothetical protein
VACSGFKPGYRQGKQGLNKVLVLANVELQQPVVEAPMTTRVFRVGEDGTAKEGDTATQEFHKEREGVVVADVKVKEQIVEIGKKLGVVCPQGSDWRKAVDGYRCGCSNHFLTFKQLGLDEGVEVQRKEGVAGQVKEGKDKAEKPQQVVVADARTKQRITEVGQKYGIVCPQGSGWFKTADGYRCGCSGHFLTFEQLGVEVTEGVEEVTTRRATDDSGTQREGLLVADAKMQQQISEVGKKVGVVCPQGGSWRLEDGGYRCGCSGHFLTYEQMGVDQGQARESIAVRTSTGTGKKSSTFVGNMLTIRVNPKL